MKIELKKQINFFELDSCFKLRLKGLLNCLQEAAAVHSARAGFETQRLMYQRNVWILQRIEILIHRPPAMGDELTVQTWHKGETKFRAYRDFEIL